MPRGQAPPWPVRVATRRWAWLSTALSSDSLLLLKPGGAAVVQFGAWLPGVAVACSSSRRFAVQR